MTDVRDVHKVAGASFIAIFVGVSTYLISTRGVHIGSDTAAYIYYFNNLSDSVFDDKFEPLFYYLARAAHFVGDVSVFFGVINVLFFVLLMRVIHDLQFVTDRITFSLLLVSLVHMSDWYLTAVTNGLRQGLAIPCIFLAYLGAYNRQWRSFLLFSSLGCAFHYSSALYLPFAALLRISYPKIVLIFIFFSFGYFFGYNEVIVKWISQVIELPLYSLVKNYAGGRGPWNGFDPLLFAYSSFWFWLSVFLMWFFPSKIRQEFRLFIIIYGILLLPYFIFGFGPFSNRYAFPAWLFLPVLYCGLIYCLRVPLALKHIAANLFFSVAVMKLGMGFL